MAQSGNENLGKLFPNAVLEDQEAIAMGEADPVVISQVPYSSPDPETDGIRMLPLENQTNPEAAMAESAAVSDKDMKAADWKEMIEGAEDEEALDAVEARYLDSEADFKTVEDAIEKKRDELGNS